ncbi:MAG: helix-turn-helix domain-containing protein [Paludibacter sp.]|nr:helix-turn-helix domain-containing protein [Paludibacter sp.]
MRICFVLQVVVYTYSNYKLIKNHGYKAQQYYSDIEDSLTIRVSILNVSMILTGCASVVLATLGRDFFKHEITGITIASVIFSSMLFIIGWLGDQQKTLNPTFERNNNEKDESQFNALSKTNQGHLLVTLTELFEEKKIYLDSKLNIVEVAAELGTNRTYISSVINQHYNQNFCTFVNQHRVSELEKLIIKHPEFSNHDLAMACGFGSVESMKRSVFAKTEKSLQEWRIKIRVT